MNKAYYNEIDPKAAQWLRNLIEDGLIAAGDVDERSIEDVTPNDLRGYTQCHFFAGIGGWSYALRLAGWQDSSHVWTGSCPCQPFSQAGQGKGLTDERHLWPSWNYLIQQCKPAIIFGEQSENSIKHGWLDLVQSDLENNGYSFGAFCVSAGGVGAPHVRKRLWFVADSQGAGLHQLNPDATGLGTGEKVPRLGDDTSSVWGAIGERAFDSVPSYGIPRKLGKVAVKGFGNAIVPQAAAAVIKSYMMHKGS